MTRLTSAKRYAKRASDRKSDAYSYNETRLAENRAAKAKGMKEAKRRGSVGAKEIGARIDAQVKAGMVQFRRSIDLDD